MISIQIIRTREFGVTISKMIRPALAFTEEVCAKTVALELENEGIVCELDACSDGVKTVHTISIDEPDQLRAAEIVAASDAAEAAVRCPGCRSLRVEFPARPRASALISALSAVAEAVIPVKEKSFCCDNCANHW